MSTAFPLRAIGTILGTQNGTWKRRRPCSPREASTLPVYISPDASLDDRVAFRPFVSVGPGCVLERDCFVENSILWDEVCVRSRASVRNSIIGANMTVEGDCIDKIVTRNGEIPIA